MKFRKRPIVIEAVQFVDSTPESELLALLEGTAWHMEMSGIVIHTLEGDMLANRGDWIIRGVKGELYPCKPDIFAATYEQVEP